MSDMLARLRALADEMDATPLYDDHGGAFAALLRDRFPEAFEAVTDAPVLERGAPEYAALMLLGKEPLSSWDLAAELQRLGVWPRGYSVEKCQRRLKRHNLIAWRQPCWCITDAGRAELARHLEDI
jgi:hypothetical protein